MIEVQGISFLVKKKILVNNISLKILPGEFVVIMGANGAGKSTLLKMIAGSLQATSGQVLFNDKKLKEYSVEALSKKRAVLSQHYHISFPLTAHEIVMMGRYPYFDHNPTHNDVEIVNSALQKMQVQHLADRDYNTLSGGEAQKIQMCRVLAQIGEISLNENKLLLLDEPVSHLDVKYQHQLLQEAKLLCQKKVSVLAVLHDINLSLKYADRILFMKDGNLIRSLPKNENIDADMLRDVFDAEANVFDLPDGKGKFVVF